MTLMSRGLSLSLSDLFIRHTCNLPNIFHLLLSEWSTGIMDMVCERVDCVDWLTSITGSSSSVIPEFFGSKLKQYSLLHAIPIT